MLKKSTLLFIGTFFLLFIGLSDYGYAHHRDDHNKGGGGDDGATDQYSASVEFDDENCGDGGDKFCSDDEFPPDGSHFYIDGDNNVGAGGDKFRFGLNLKTGTTRRFFLNFSDRVGETGIGELPVLADGLTGLPNLDGGNGNVFSTGESFSLLDMTPNGDIRDRVLSITFRDTEGDAWGLSFLPDVCDSDPVTVTRIGNTWIFEPKDDGIACLRRAKNGKHGPPILQGLYKVPFKFTVHVPPEILAP